MRLGIGVQTGPSSDCSWIVVSFAAPRLPEHYDQSSPWEVDYPWSPTSLPSPVPYSTRIGGVQYEFVPPDLRRCWEGETVLER